MFNIFQSRRRQVFCPESRHRCIEKFCKYQKCSCYVGHSPKKGVCVCVSIFIQARVFFILVHLWTFHLDCSQSPVPRKIVGIEHLPLRAAILVSKVPRQAWGLVSNLRRRGGGGGGPDGLGVGEKYLFSFFLAPLPHCSKPRGPPPSVHLKTR